LSHVFATDNRSIAHSRHTPSFVTRNRNRFCSCFIEDLDEVDAPNNNNKRLTNGRLSVMSSPPATGGERTLTGVTNMSRRQMVMMRPVQRAISFTLLKNRMPLVVRLVAVWRRKRRAAVRLLSLVGDVHLHL
jgi:hypothetical protein